MSALPADNIFVDPERRIVRPWLDILRKLQPSTSLSSADVTTLKTFIAAAAEILAEPETVEIPEFTPYAVDVQEFLASGTWLKPSFGSVALIEMWGPGGSGASRSTSGFASGGGGGVYVQRWVLLSSLADSEIYTAGVPGAGVSGNANGNAGTASTFGAWLTAPGGGAGANTVAGGSPVGGFGAGVTATSSGIEAIAGSTGTVNAATRNSGAPGGGVSSGGSEAPGGDSFNGGAGGGASSGSGDDVGGTAHGAGGNGGAGNGSGDGTSGSTPGGGGGASNTGTSGTGGLPYCKVTVF